MDKVYKQTASIKIFNVEYPCKSVDFTVTLNTPITFNATILGFKDKKETNKLTVGTITKLASSLQNKIYEDPKNAKCKIKASSLNKNDLEVDGIITSIYVSATTSGGLTLKITGTSYDTLMNMYNGECYSASLSAKEMIIKKGVRQYGEDKAMAWINKPLNQDLITDRISELLSGMSDKFPEFIKSYKYMEVEKKLAEALHESNKKILNEQIKPFLSRSKPKVFGGTVKISDQPICSAINNGLCSYFFNNGAPFLTTLISLVNRDFAMWYIPLPKNGWASGELREQTYGDENASKDIKVPISSFTSSSGNYTGRDAPCKGVAVVAGIHTNAAAALGVRDNTNKVYAVFPDKPKRDWGNYLTYQAPAWLTVNSLTGKTINNQEQLQIMQQGKTQAKGRSVQKAATNMDKINKKVKEELDYYYNILKYLSEKFYYRSLLQSSVLNISGPYWGVIDANVGDMVNVSAEAGGKIAKGILQSISYNINTDGNSTVSLTLISTQLSGVKIK